MMYLIPVLLSFIIGFLFIRLILKNSLPGVLFCLFLSGILGLGLSGFLTLTSFLCFNQLVIPYVIGLNLAAMGILLFLNMRIKTTPNAIAISQNDTLALGLIIFICAPMYVFASLYPNGGWDAWGTWNTKARFLFLGGTSWTNMFDPIAWRTQVLYPFLLPLINVWGWCFGTMPNYLMPLLMTCIIPFLAAGILYAGLKELTNRSLILLIAPAWIFTNMFTIELSASQYSDLLGGLFLLTSITLFLLFQRSKNIGFLVFMGLCLGLQAFTKVEGTALSILTALTVTGLIATNPSLKDVRKRALIVFLIATATSMIPIIIYSTCYAPRESGIFINGLTSKEHPVSWERFWFIWRYYALEFTHPKWNWFWIIFPTAIFLNFKQSFRRELWIFPIILSGYFIIFTFSYNVNTFYEIVWWTTTSLNRVIFALIPTITLWIFLSVVNL